MISGSVSVMEMMLGSRHLIKRTKEVLLQSGFLMVVILGFDSLVDVMLAIMEVNLSLALKWNLY